jgi:protein gp37
MNRTSIEWTDFTANPLKYRDAAGRVVWGCAHASPGCEHCYAESLAHRYRKGGPFTAPAMRGRTPFLDEVELRRMLTYRPASGHRVFVGDMTDIFGDWVPDALLDRLFAVFALRLDVTWQVLTKRADRLRDYMTDLEREARWMTATADLIELFDLDEVGLPVLALRDPWLPLRNCWVGVSAEDQRRADERIPALLQTPAAVRFVSAEPLLGPVTFRRGQLGAVADCDECRVRNVRVDEDGCCLGCGADALSYGLDWVIVGGESGPGARICEMQWVRTVVSQCRDAGVPVFVKQLGSRPVDVARPRLKDRKGGDPTEWPADLQMRQFPAQRTA